MLFLECIHFLSAVYVSLLLARARMRRRHTAVSCDCMLLSPSMALFSLFIVDEYKEIIHEGITLTCPRARAVKGQGVHRGLARV